MSRWAIAGQRRGYASPVTRRPGRRASDVLVPRAGDQSSLAWSIRGRTSTSFTSTCGGWVSANITARAMSSGSSAPLGAVVEERACRPCRARSASTLMSVSATSWRSASPIAVTACLVARVERAGQRRAGPPPSWSAGRARRSARGSGGGRRGSTAPRRSTLVSIIAFQCSTRLLEEAALGAEAGVGEEDVEPAEALERGGDERLLVVPAGHVAAHAPARAPSPPSSSASASSLSCERAASTTRQPTRRRWRAVAAPMPLLAPVMTRTGESGIARVLAPRVRSAAPVAAPHPTEARFPAVPLEAGHYESFYLKALPPGRAARRRGSATRSTSGPGALPNGSLWFTLFDGAAEGPRAHKETHARTERRRRRVDQGGGGIDAAPARRWGPSTAAEWDLRFSSVPSRRCATCRAPGCTARRCRARSCSARSRRPASTARCASTAAASTVDDWRGMVGHNWGAQHAERWIWLHAPDRGRASWLDVALGEVKLGPLTTPVDRQRRPLARRRAPRARRPGPQASTVHEAPDGCDFVLPGKGTARARDACAAPRERLRRLGLRRPGRPRAQHRQLLDRRHDACAWSGTAGRRRS